MDTSRAWLLPALFSLPNAVLAVLSVSGAVAAGAVAAAGLVLAVVVQCAALAVRHRAPVRALAGTVAGMVTGLTAAPDHFVNLCVFVALYAVAVRRGGRVTALATGAAVLGGWLPGAVRGGSVPALLTDLGITSVLYVACAGAGEARRQWLGGRWTAAGRLARAQADRRGAVAGERHRLARELHDVSAHHLTSVVVTADTARRLGARRPELAAEALSFAARTGEETLAALRELAAVMDDVRPPAPPPVSGRLRDLVDGFGRLGRPVDADLPDDLAGPAAEAAFGIVREALTNALRHAPGAVVRVRVRRTGDGLLRLTVWNGPPRGPEDRAGAAAGLGSGNGLTGMRERALAVGGTLTAGPDGAGGWRVGASLPDGTGPVLPDRPARRRDLARELRLADACSVFTAVVLPLFLVLSAVAEGALPGAPSGLAVLAVLLTLHALPLLGRRRAPRAALWAVAATAWLIPVAALADWMPSPWGSLLPGAVVTEAMAVYAAGAYGRGAARSFGAVPVAAVNAVAALTVTAAVDRTLVLPDTDPSAVAWTAFLLASVTGPLLLVLWAAGAAVRGHRLRVVTREEGALADSVRNTAREAAAERRRIAAELQASVLDHTTRMVRRAHDGNLDDVAAAARAALAAMRELLRGLRGGADTEVP